MIETLKRIGYRGDVTLEADSFMKRLPKELFEEGARFMAKTAEYIRKKLLEK